MLKLTIMSRLATECPDWQLHIQVLRAALLTIGGLDPTMLLYVVDHTHKLLSSDRFSTFIYVNKHTQQFHFYLKHDNILTLDL